MYDTKCASIHLSDENQAAAVDANVINCFHLYSDNILSGSPGFIVHQISCGFQADILPWVTSRRRNHLTLSDSHRLPCKVPRCVKLLVFVGRMGTIYVPTTNISFRNRTWCSRHNRLCRSGSPTPPAAQHPVCFRRRSIVGAHQLSRRSKSADPQLRSNCTRGSLLHTLFLRLSVLHAVA